MTMKVILRLILTATTILTFLGYCACQSPAGSKSDESPVLVSVTGPEESQVGATSAITAVAYDPDGPTVRFFFASWVEQNQATTYMSLGWTDFVSNHTPATKSIRWETPGTYVICCHCMDAKGNESSHLRIKIQVA